MRVGGVTIQRKQTILAKILESLIAGRNGVVLTRFVVLFTAKVGHKVSFFGDFVPVHSKLMHDQLSEYDPNIGSANRPMLPGQVHGV